MADTKDSYTLEALLTGDNSRLKKVIDQAVAMLERLENRKSDDVKIDGDVKPLQKKVEMAKRLSEQIDNVKSDVEITADTDDLNRKVKQAQMATELLDGKKAQIEIITKNTEAIAKMKQVRLSAKMLSSERPSINVDMDTAAAESKAQRLKAMLKSIPNKIKVHSDIQIGKALTQVALLKTALNGNIANKAVDLKIDTNGLTRAQVALKVFEAQVEATRVKLGLLGNPFLGLSTIAIPVLASIIPAIMAIGNAIAVVGGGVIGLAGAFGIAGAGAMAFGAMAISAYKMLDSGAIQATAQTNAFKTSLASLKTQWQSLVQTNASSIFTTMTNGINIAKTALSGLTPFITSVATSMTTLSARLLSFFQTSSIANNFFAMFNTIGVQAFTNVMNAAGSFGAGLMSVITQFGPLFSWMAQGLANMGAQFMAWSQKVSTAQGIKSFISYVQTNLPLIGQIFGNTFNAIFSLFTAFGSNSQTIFQSLAQMSAKFAEWSAQVAASDGFKQFIDYIQQNGPVLMSTIGNIATAIMQFVTAMAPIGAAVLQVVSAVAQWIAGFMQANPVITQIVGALVMFGGAIMKLAPLFRVVFSAVQKVWTAFNMLRTGLQIVAAAFTVVASPALMIVAALVAVGVALYLLWTKCETFRNGVMMLVGIMQMLGAIIMSALGQAFTWLGQQLQVVWTALQSFGSFLATVFVAAWNGLVAIVQTVWTAIVTAVQTGITFVTTILTTLGTFLMTIFTAAWNGLVSVVTTVWNLISTAVQAGIQIVTTILSTLGTFLMTVFSAAWNGLVIIVTTVWNAISTAITTAVNVIKTIISTVFNAIKSFIMLSINGWKIIITNGWNLIKSAVTNSVNAIKSVITAVWNAIKSVVTSVMNGIKSAITNAWNAIKSAVTSAVNAIKSVITSVWNAIKSTVTSVMNGIKSAITNAWNNIKSACQNAMNAIKSAVTNGMNNVKSAVRSGIQGAVSAAKSFVGDMRSAGTDLIRGMINGIKNMANDLVSAAKGVVGNAIKAAKSLLKIHSPSRVFKEIGRYTVEGMVLGLKKNSPAVYNASKKMAGNAIKAVANIKSTSFKKSKEAASKYYSVLAKTSESGGKKLASNNKRIASIQKRLRGKLKASTRSDLNKQLVALQKENAAYKLQRKMISNLKDSSKKSVYNLTKVARSRENLAKRMKVAHENLKEIYKERQSFRKSILDDTRGYGSVAKSKASTSQGLIADMKARAKAIAEYAKNVNALKKKGVSQDIIADILSAGIEGGSQQAKILANASKSTIKQLNGIQAQIKSTTHRLATKQTNDFYLVGLNTAKGIVQGLQKQDNALKAAATRLASLITTTVKKKLGIHSPSRVFAWLGNNTVLGFIKGVAGHDSKIVNTMSNLAQRASNAFNPQFASSVPDLTSNLRNATSNIASQVNADVVNTVRSEPVGVTLDANFVLGNREYNGFVGDITDKQNSTVRLREVYDV